MKDIELITKQNYKKFGAFGEKKHEFDDALPRIYRKVTGKIFDDPRPNSSQNSLELMNGNSSKNSAKVIPCNSN
jgi:DNA sulfur modification protein DndC